MDDAGLFRALLLAEDESEADGILRRAGCGLDNEAVWRPLGEMPNNTLRCYQPADRADCCVCREDHQRC